MVLVVTDDTNSARDVISISMITFYVKNKPQSVNNHTLKMGSAQNVCNVYNIFSCSLKNLELYLRISALASKKKVLHFI